MQSILSLPCYDSFCHTAFGILYFTTKERLSDFYGQPQVEKSFYLPQKQTLH